MLHQRPITQFGLTHVYSIEVTKQLHLSVALTKSFKTLSLVANLPDVKLKEIKVKAPAELHNGT